MKKIAFKVLLVIFVLISVDITQSIIESQFILSSGKISAQQVLNSDALYVYNNALDRIKWIIHPIVNILISTCVGVVLFWRELKNEFKKGEM